MAGPKAGTVRFVYYYDGMERDCVKKRREQLVITHVDALRARYRGSRSRLSTQILAQPLLDRETASSPLRTDDLVDEMLHALIAELDSRRRRHHHFLRLGCAKSTYARYGKLPFKTSFIYEFSFKDNDDVESHMKNKRLENSIKFIIYFYIFKLLVSCKNCKVHN